MSVATERGELLLISESESVRGSEGGGDGDGGGGSVLKASEKKT